MNKEVSITFDIWWRELNGINTKVYSKLLDFYLTEFGIKLLSCANTSIVFNIVDRELFSAFLFNYNENIKYIGYENS